MTEREYMERVMKLRHGLLRERIVGYSMRHKKRHKRSR